MVNFFGNTAKSGIVKGDSPKAPVGTKVIVVAGQSNSGGEQYTLEPLPIELQGNLAGFYRIFDYDEVIVHDDFAIVNDTTSLRVACDLNLGYLYQKFHNENIYIIKYSHGATALSQEYVDKNWNVATEGSLFDGLKDCITTALGKLTVMGLNPTIRGFVWYQGEEDNFQGQTKEQYKLNEQNFFSALKEDLSLPDLNIYSILISMRGGASGNYPAIRQAKIENSFIIPNYTTLETIGLPFDTFGEGYHLTSAGQIELGRRIFELLKFN